MITERLSIQISIDTTIFMDLTKLELSTARKQDFDFNDELSNIIQSGPFSETSIAKHKLSKLVYVYRSINVGMSVDVKNLAYQVFIDIDKMKYKCMMPVKYFILPEKRFSFPAICTEYNKNNKSLYSVINILRNETIDEIDATQKLIILYGIALYLRDIHKDEKIHGRLKASNVILNEKYEPFVSDPLMYKLNENEELITDKRKSIDYVVSFAPEILNKEPITNKVDIYSFGILALQLVTENINVYSNNSKNYKVIIEFIKNNQLPDISDKLFLGNLISDCLKKDPNERPEASDIIDMLENVCSSNGYCDIKKLNSYKESLNKETKAFNSKVEEYKKAADNGDVEKMYLYGRARYFGEGCTKDDEEAIKYIFRAGKKGHEEARKLHVLILQSETNDSDDENDHIKTEDDNTEESDNIKEEEDNTEEDNKEEDNTEEVDNPSTFGVDDSIPKTSPIYDTSFNEEPSDISEIVKKVDSDINIIEKKVFDEKILSKNNFVFTAGAKERLTKLYRYIEVGVPVLLEGPTGTSKTLSVEIVCQLLKKKLIRFNLSSETKAADLLGRYVGDPDSWAGISLHDGPFITAFEKGYPILLDEINLASQECLQFIEEALDSGVISIEIPGKPLAEIKMHQDFRLIATQNPNKGLFAHKRQDLGIKFLSRFQVINFPSFTKDELLNIARGLAKGFGYIGHDPLIKDLVEFHMEWSSSKEIANDVQCFTVREIAATVKALADNEKPLDTVMTIYGARYTKDMKSKLTKMLNKYVSFRNLKEDKFEYPKNFPECYQNNNLSRALKSVFFSFKNYRHVILAAKEGNGITQVARWISRSYDSTNGRRKSVDDEFFCVCTEETKCSDLVGCQKPSGNNTDSQELIEWKNGFLTNAIIQGKCAVLDCLDEAPSTVTERLNALLDQKYDGKEKEFEIPENPKQDKVKIDPNFRLLCTCNIDKINQMSPAFVNRFDVIVLEDQLENIGASLQFLISKLLKQARQSESAKPTVKKASASIDESSDSDVGFDDSDNEDESDGSVGGDYPAIDDDYLPSQEIIELITKEIRKMKDKTMLTLSRLCKATFIYLDFFKDDPITKKEIAKFASNMLMKDKDFVVPENIQNALLSRLKNQEDNNDSKFFFKGSKSLEQFISKLYAASLIHMPVCVYGPTGAGKTSAARAFARIRPCNSKNPLQMHSFHAGTRPNHFYGTTTLKDGKINFINGTLTNSLKDGSTFIADEMNLSSITNMKSLAPALEPCAGQRIFLPGVGETITIDKEFFFVACQNELGTIGRNAIPVSIASRFRYFDYPKQVEEDIKSICLDISKSIYKNIAVPSFKDEDARNIGKYMITLNNQKQKIIPQWSLRDVTKLLQRMCHQDSQPNDFEGMNIYYNTLYYTMSPVSDEEAAKIFPVVMKLIGDSFKLPPDKRKDLEDSYKATPKIEEKTGKGTFIMKGKCGVSYKIVNSQTGVGLESFLNGVFKLNLSDRSEPVLFMGASGFKTFLAQQAKPNAKVITLNQESTVAQLLGSSAFLTNTEAKYFYLDNICKIASIHKKEELKEKLRNGELKRADIESKTNKIIATLPDCFKYAIKHLTDKLFDESSGEETGDALSNIKIEFRPGLFLSAILEKNSLILKNLQNLPTIILERFNELFSGKHNLTLNEDIYNTFTGQSKELTNFDSSFRVFATCPPNSAAKLSEAVLSRFTVIYIPEYKSVEQKTVLKNFSGFGGQRLDESLIQKLIDFSEKMKASIGKSIPFSQMISIIEMCLRLNAWTDSSQHINNLGIVLFRVISGLLEKRKKHINKIYNIFDSLKIPLSESMKNLSPEDPTKVETIHGEIGVRSTLTNYFIKSPKAKEIKRNIAFTPMFIEMIDIIHLGITAHVPVILEGPPGQGKQTAINFLCDKLDYSIINIIISQSTKVDDLLGKLTITRDKDNKIHVEIIKTKLVKSIDADSELSNTIIVFHNINNASPAVLEVLTTIFDMRHNNILLPDGSTITKGKANLIGIFNPRNGLCNRDRLPTSLIFSSIYHIVKKPGKKDALLVANALFENTEFKSEIENFYNKYEKIRKINADNSSSSLLTLSDISKYVTFRSKTFGCFDESTISQMIFAYRFVQQETIHQVLKEIGVGAMKFNPTFSYNTERKEIFIRISKEAKSGIILPLYSDKIDAAAIQSALLCLTLPQKHCLLFLVCSLLSKCSCIVQGSTASGKSHIIRLFAKMFGQKLNVYQMNSDTGISILTGQSVLENELSKEDYDKLKVVKVELDSFEEIKKFIESNFSDNIKQWKPEHFKQLIEQIKDYRTKNVEITREKKEILAHDEKIIRQIILPANRFKHAESSFIRAMNNGEWVLIDGIESAPPEIAEKVATLCGNEPELDLCELGEDYYYTRKDIPKSKRIHDNFHLFVTYNPTSKAETKLLDPVFINKCVSFTLPPMDSSVEYSAQILLGSLINMSFPNDIAVEIGARMAMVHSIAKLESTNDRDSFAGDMQFTGRTLKFIKKEFDLYRSQHSKDLKDVHKPICNSIQTFYWNSYINAEKENCFHDKLIKEFEKDPTDDIISKLDCNEMDPKQRNKEILNNLRNIQLYATSLKNKSTMTMQECNFSFIEFVRKCKLVSLSDVPFIYMNIQETLAVINKECKCDVNQSIFEKEYAQLKVIEHIFEDIKKGMTSVRAELADIPIGDKELANGDLERPLSQLNLLSLLQSNNSLCISPIVPRYIFDENIYEIMKVINELAKEQTLEQFGKLIAKIKENPDLFKLVDEIFPYNLFFNTSFKNICYFLPMFLSLHKEKVTFHIIVLDSKFEFIYAKTSKFKPTFIFNEKDQLVFSTGTFIELIYDDTGKTDNIRIKEDAKKEKLEKNSAIIYSMVTFLTERCSKLTKKIIKEYRSDKEFPDNPRSTQISRLLQLYNDKTNESSLIARIWAVVYTFPLNCINVLGCFLHPLEYETLISVYNLFGNINKDNVNEIYNFTKNLGQFGSGNSYLWRAKNNTLMLPQTNEFERLKAMKDNITGEITVLNDTPTIDEKIWSPQPYILVLKGEIQKIDDIIRYILQDQEDNRIKQKLQDLIDNLQTSKIDNEFKDIRDKIVQQIEKIKEKSPTKELYISCKSQVDRFKQLLNEKQVKSDQNSIQWPAFTPTSALGKIESNNVKLFKHVVWFSNIASIFEKISSRETKNLFEIVILLKEYPEMQSVSDLLVNRTMASGRKAGLGILPDDIDIIYSTLNAHFIYKLYADNLLDKVGELDKIFNSLTDRNQIPEEDLMWIHNIVNKFPPNFNLVLPNFKPNDLFFLFVGYVGNSDKTLCGPLIVNKSQDIANTLINHMFTKKENFENCAKFISEYIYLLSFACRREDLPKDKTEFLKNLDELIKSADTPNDIITGKQILEIGEKLKVLEQSPGVIRKYKFTFDDREMLCDDWTTKRTFINKYPSLVYWICKNKCGNQIRSLYKATKFEDNKLPFWLFAVRIMSNKGCVSFSGKKTGVGELISKIINKELKDNLIANRIQGTDWINVLLPNIPSDFVVLEYKFLYQFFINLSEDENQNYVLIKFKKEAIKNFTQNIIGLLLNGEAQKIFSFKLRSCSSLDDADDITNNVVYFIKNPTNFVNTVIKAYIENACNSILESDELKQLKNYSASNNEQYFDNIAKFDEYVKDEKDNKQKQQDKINEDKKADEFKAQKIGLIKTIEDYNERINKINTQESMKEKDMIATTESIEWMLKDIPKELLDKTNVICTIYEIRYSYMNGYKFYIPRSKKPFNLDNYGEGRLVFRLKKLTFDQIKSGYFSNGKNKVTITEKGVSKINFYQVNINQDFINDYCRKKADEYTQHSSIPDLIFGSNTEFIPYGTTPEKMKEILKNTKLEIDCVIKVISDSCSNKEISEQTLNEIRKIENKITKLSSDLKVKFDNGTECAKVQNLLDLFKTNLEQYNSYIEKIYSKISDGKVFEQLRSLKSHAMIFNNNYELPLNINIIGNVYNINFGYMKNTDFLSTPILTIGKRNSISCCFNCLQCTIGPIVSSLFSKDIKVNFISFIDVPITIKVETEKKEYSSWFKGKDDIYPGDPAQIYISLPPAKSSRLENHEIKGNIKVTSKKHNELLIPCVFNIKLTPLSILISCEEYKLAFKDDQFYLCTNSVVSESTITFSLKNFYSVENESTYPNLCYKLASLDGNQAKQPEVIENKEKSTLKLIVPKVIETTKLNFALKIAFSEHYSICINANTVISPIDFVFSIYDYTQKKYVFDNLSIPYSIQSIARDINLHCIIDSPCFPMNLNGKINFSLPITVKKQFKGIGDTFTIKSKTEFIITIKEDSNQKYPFSGKNHSIIACINGVEKKISVSFVNVNTPIIIHDNTINTECLMKYPIMQHTISDDRWSRFDSKTAYIDMTDLYCIVNPFRIEWFNKVVVNYNQCKCEAIITTINKFTKNNTFIYMNKNLNYSMKEALIGQCSGFMFNKIISIGGHTQNKWYPFFNVYQSRYKTWQELPLDSRNLHIANSRLGTLPRTYPDNDFDSLATILSNISNIDKFPKYYEDGKNFFILVGHESEFMAINNYINSSDKSMYPIIAHNLILLFYKVFSRRYEEIKKNDFYLVPSNFSEVFKKVADCYNIYTKIDNHSKSEFDQNIQNKREEFKKEVKKAKLQDFPKENNQEAFLINELVQPEPKKRTDEPIKEDKTQTQFNTVGSNEIKVSLPAIEIPKGDDQTITALNSFFTNCIQQTRILPVFVKNIIINKNNKLEPQAVECTSNLIEIYNKLPEKDYSIISDTVNEFLKSFSSMIRIFKKAGVDLTSLVRRLSNSDEAVHDYIQYPEKDSPYLPIEQWIYRDKNNNNVVYDRVMMGGNAVVTNNDDIIDVSNTFLIFNKQGDKKPDAKEENIKAEESKNGSVCITKIIMQNNLDMESDSSDDEPDDMNDESDSEDDKSKKAPKEKVVVVKSLDNDHSKTVQSDEFDGMVTQFKEEDGIKRAIARMKEIDKSSPLKIPSQTPSSFNPSYLDPDRKIRDPTTLSIFQLYLQSSSFYQEFVRVASIADIPYSNISVNILVDCSSYISDENKSFNMMVICALTSALTTLEIPYSVAVVADQNFRGIIKKFDEPHSLLVLQRICDCLMIKRYRTKLARTTKFAIDNMRFTSDEARNQRAVFTFSDGLDEQLVLTKSWAESLLTDSSFSFGFVFIKSSRLDGDNLRFIEKVWSSFEIETMKHNSRCAVKIASIKAIISGDTIKSLSEMFAFVMKGSFVNEAEVENPSLSSPEFKLDKDVELSRIDIFSDYLNKDFSGCSEIYTERTNALSNAASKLDKLDVSHYRNHLMNISSCTISPSLKKDDVSDFIRKFIEPRRMINQASLEAIFKPNKASQTVLSTTGTDFDITALILNLINPVPDPLIYLEEKGGLIRNYGVSVVIDTSISCFHNLSGHHSFQTIRTILSYFASLDLPCFDLILTGNSSPVVLCSEVGTLRALSPKSHLWESLLAAIQNPLPRADLASAIHTAFDLRRMRSTEYMSLLFVLTDGLYQTSERKAIVDCVNNCAQSGINTIGVGIGIYPIGIEKLFPQIVFSPNPQNVVKGIASFFGENIDDSPDSMPSIKFMQADGSKIESALKNVIDNIDKPVFKSLKTTLHDISPSLDAFDDFYNEEKAGCDKGYDNPVGQNTELYVKDSLKSQRILIVMLWDHTMSKNEEEFVAKEYIFKSSESGRTECIKTAVEHFGIEIDVVQNYEDAIRAITRQSKRGFCDYYAVWIMCGPPYRVLPEKSANPDYVGEFIKVLIKFWKNGGSLVFWAEGDPLTYQVNLFLRTVTFENESSCPSGKTKLEIGGEHKGYNILTGDPSGKLRNNRTFNRSPQQFKECERTTISHNLAKIFEGITISFANNDISPFKAFSKDSEGGISSLFYCSNIKEGTGDIVIDCGYTKCFTKMTSDGTYRYIQNIAGWTARPEVHKRIDPDIQPRDWRPKAVNHSMRRPVKWSGFKEIPKIDTSVDVKKLRTLWAIDCSGSVEGDELYHSELRKIVDEYYKSGDDIWLWDSDDELRNYSYNELIDFMDKKEGFGCTDSSLIADIACKSSIREHLIIVTDGHVDTGSIDKSDEKMKSNNIRFKAVTTFIIGKGGDLSVGAPYCRGCQNKTYGIKAAGEKELYTELNSEDLKALENIPNINSYRDFINECDKLESAIQAKTLGTSGDRDLRRKLEEMRNRIERRYMSDSEKENFTNKINELLIMTDGALREAFNMNKIAAAKKGTK